MFLFIRIVSRDMQLFFHAASQYLPLNLLNITKKRSFTIIDSSQEIRLNISTVQKSPKKGWKSRNLLFQLGPFSGYEDEIYKENFPTLSWIP